MTSDARLESSFTNDADKGQEFSAVHEERTHYIIKQLSFSTFKQPP